MPKMIMMDAAMMTGYGKSEGGELSLVLTIVSDILLRLFAYPGNTGQRDYQFEGGWSSVEVVCEEHSFLLRRCLHFC